MEFPGLGKHCTLAECNQLDFLPFTCDSCKQIYCKDHVTYDRHNCTESYKKDVRVPVCPLCNQPVSFKPGDLPDRRVNDHIENDCKSDLALSKRKTYTNKCSVKGCKQRELVPVTCATCKRNFCLRHRHENDHECLNINSTGKSLAKKSAAPVAAGQAAASRFDSYNTKRRPPPQKSSLSSIGGDLNRDRQSRQQRGPNATQSDIRSQPLPQSTNPAGMTEEEALAFAIQASLGGNQTAPDAQSKPPTINETDEDLALARALAQSEVDERNRQRQSRTTQEHGSKGSSCNLS